MISRCLARRSQHTAWRMLLMDLPVRHNDNWHDSGGGPECCSRSQNPAGVGPWQVPGLLECVNWARHFRRRNSHPSCMPPVSFAAVEPIGHKRGRWGLSPPPHPWLVLDVVCNALSSLAARAWALVSLLHCFLSSQSPLRVHYMLSSS